MTLIRLAFGRPHWHRLRAVYKEQAPSRFRADPKSVLFAEDANHHGIPNVWHSGTAKNHATQSVSNSGCPKVGLLKSVSGALAGSVRNHAMPHSGGTSVSRITLGLLQRSFSTGHHSLSHHVVEQLPREVTIGDNIVLTDKISLEEERISKNVDSFEDRYYRFVRPLLVSRCLLAPAGLDDPTTVFLHRQTYRICEHYPRYLSSFDIMAFEDSVSDHLEWKMFLDYLTMKKIYIIEDMEQSISYIQSLVYDHGIIGINDGLDVYKGECDASFANETACLAYIIWKGDTIICSAIYQDITKCKTATDAEVFAAFALLDKAKELNIVKLQVCSDCEAVTRILGGELILDKDHELRNRYLMLRSMRRHFKSLVPTWKPRELMTFVDDLAKTEIDDDHTPLLFSTLEQKWSSYLTGLPLFRVEWTGTTSTTVSKFAKVHIDDSFGSNSNSEFFIQVEDEYKIDCLIGLKQSIGPNNLVVYVNDIEDKSRNFVVDLEKIVDNHSEQKFGSYTCFSEYPPNDDLKTLVVVFDAVIPKNIYYDDDAVHVLLVTSNESKFTYDESKPKKIRKLIYGTIPEFTALEFIYFNGVKYPLNKFERKGAYNQRKKKDMQKLSSSVAEGEQQSSLAEEEDCNT